MYGLPLVLEVDPILMQGPCHLPTHDACSHETVSRKEAEGGSVLSVPDTDPCGCSICCFLLWPQTWVSVLVTKIVAQRRSGMTSPWSNGGRKKMLQAVLKKHTLKSRGFTSGTPLHETRILLSKRSK